MNWFKGPIEKGILQSKKDQLIFMVHVYDLKSNEMDLVWNDENVYSMCNSECVSLRIDSTSETFKQFSEIYKVLCLPSTFFIGENGMPLEIVAGVVNVDDFFSKLDKVVKTHNETKKKLNNETVVASNFVPEKQDDVASNAASSIVNDKKEKSIEEKVAEARKKIAELQEKKQEEEKEKERNIEIERRKLGQEMLKTKQLKEEQEAKRLAEERKKEKLNEELAKKRVLEQIQRDREEKQKKYQQEKQELLDAELNKKLEADREKQAALEAIAAQNSLYSKIQFRLVDGSNIIEKFESSQKLSDIKVFLIKKLRENNYNQTFTMHTMHPKRIFNDDDMNTSLKDLNLSPTATILVIPSQKSSVQRLQSSLPVQTNGLFSIFANIASFVLIPVAFIWNMISGFLGSNRNNNETNRQNNSNVTSEQQSLTPNSSINDNRLRGRLLQNYNSNKDENLRKRETFKKDGNIARLNDNNDDNDDDTNTWNGNSTQQM